MTDSTSQNPKRINLSYAQKLFLLATVPLVLAVAAISVLVAHQSRLLAEREIAALETQLVEAKKEELKNYVTLARMSFINIYGRAAPTDEQAKLRVTQILSSMLYGTDGYFFVYDYDGTNLVSPRRTELITRNWSGLTDEEGTEIVDTLIEKARTGGGYHSYLWVKPSTGETEHMISYAIGLQDWRWVVGTGVFIDDVLQGVALARAETEARVRRTFIYIAGITIAALLLVFLSGLFLNIRERRLADAKLKELTQRIIDTQEEERSRVARELHDGISQILVGVRYAMELARKRISASDPRAEETVERGMSHLNGAIQEVRRISRDLRPGVLDDLGLGPAVKSLADEFSHRTGITAEFNTVVFRNRLDEEARIALYRVAQEALTNIERHANATRTTIDLFGHRNGATLRISDNGLGLETNSKSGKGTEKSPPTGLGLRNMQERMEQLNGTLIVTSNGKGTTIEAQVPLSHMLSPEGSRPTSRRLS